MNVTRLLLPIRYSVFTNPYFYLMNKTRLEAFSDGVIAIIITIMVLEIKMPDAPTFAALWSIKLKLLSYVLSFIFIGIYWANHHHLVHVVKTVSAGIIWSNLNLLFWLSLVPLATAWMGETHFAPLTVALYAVLLNLCGLAYTILQRVIIRYTPLSEALQLALKKQSVKGYYSLAGYTLAIPFAFVQPAISGLLFILVSLIWVIPDRNIEKAAEKE